MAGKTIRVPPDSDLARILEEADDMPVWLKTEHSTYRLAREVEEPWTEYDSEAAWAGMEAAAGVLTAQEAEMLKEYVRHAREEGSRPIDRT